MPADARFRNLSRGTRCADSRWERRRNARSGHPPAGQELSEQNEGIRTIKRVVEALICAKAAMRGNTKGYLFVLYRSTVFIRSLGPN